MQLSRRILPPLLGLLAVVATVLPAPGSSLGTGYPGSLLRNAPFDDGDGFSPCRSRAWSPTKEEALRGTTAWRPSSASAPVTGYLDRTAARCGDEVEVHLSGRGPAVLSLYRVGWYAGKGGRLVWTSRPVPAHPQRPLRVDGTTRMAEAHWPVAARLTVEPSWTPGMYLLVVRPAGSRAAPGVGGVMPLVIPERTEPSPLLAVASTLTWAAYNDAGGYSTYHGEHGAPPSTAASLDRPLKGAGLRHLLVYDLPLARFMSRAHLAVGWTTDDEVDRIPATLTDHAGLVFPGHSEYWTARMYDGVEAARNQGVNLAFLGANPVYWQTRLQPSDNGPRRRMLIYREVERDPVAEETPVKATVRWRDSPLRRDEAELVGTTYADWGVRAGMRVVDGPAWLLAGTGLREGSMLVNAAANEVDRLSDARGAQPVTLQVVLRGAYTRPSGELRDFAATYYTSPGGAAVYAAGTTAWPCGLDRTCPFGGLPTETSRAMRAITANLLHAFSTRRFGLLHPSVPTVVVPVGKFWSELPARMRGTGGVRMPGGLDEDDPS